MFGGDAAHPTARYLSVSVPCGSRAEADAIADRLVADRLAACVHCHEIASTYEWDGAVHHDVENVLTVATHEDRLDRVVETVTSLHSYELPAISWVELAGTPAYLRWVGERVGVSGLS
jgi:periplasmic divalent cation tolerance protein